VRCPLAFAAIVISAIRDCICAERYNRTIIGNREFKGR
jgi:hypothetical protein